MENTLDARGLACPQPVILTKKALAELSGGNLVVLVDNSAAAGNVAAFAEAQGLSIETRREGGDFAVTILQSAAAGSACACLPLTQTVILVASDKLGVGDEQFGATLLQNFIFALTAAEVKPACLIFLNSGAHLTCEGSPVLESLAQLNAAGSEILTCGACLDFYQLKTLLKVGQVSNMYTISEKLLQAGNVIRI